jgi:hypothetical protein
MNGRRDKQQIKYGQYSNRYHFVQDLSPSNLISKNINIEIHKIIVIVVLHGYEILVSHIKKRLRVSQHVIELVSESVSPSVTRASKHS